MALKRCSSSAKVLERYLYELYPTIITDAADIGRDPTKNIRKLWTTDVEVDSFDISVRFVGCSATDERPAIGIIPASLTANTDSMEKCIQKGFFVSMLGCLFGASTQGREDIEARIAETHCGNELRLAFEAKKGFQVIDHSGVAKKLDFKRSIPMNKYVVCMLLHEGNDVEIYANRSHKLPRISLGRMWEERQFTDVKVTCSDGEVLAHRSVLCMASPVFRSMLQGSMKEATNAAFSIDDATTKEVEDMFSFIYTETLKETPATVLLPLAHRYQLDSLVYACCRNILDMLHVKNVVDAVKTLRPLREQPDIVKSWKKLVDKVSADKSLTEIALAEL